MPDNYMYLGLMSVVFPRATFIHCRRDLRDIAVSCWMTDFRSIRWANDPEHIASRFQQYRRMMDHWGSVLPAPIHDVDYEETVDDLESVARRLIAACGLEWDPACLEFHRNERPIRTASVTQVRQPIYTKSVARWRTVGRWGVVPRSCVTRIACGCGDQVVVEGGGEVVGRGVARSVCAANLVHVRRPICPQSPAASHPPRWRS